MDRIRLIIREAIDDFLKKENQANIDPHKMIFISYGTEKYDPKKTREVVADTSYFQNHPDEKTDKVIYSADSLRFNKPRGGLWASPLSSKLGWGEWCASEDFNVKSLNSHFMFKIKRNAKIYIIDTIEDLKKLEIPTHRDSLYPIQLDFSILLKEGYDGVFATENAVVSLRNEALGSWDVESICIFNTNIVIPYDGDAFETAVAHNPLDITNKEDYKSLDDEYTFIDDNGHFNTEYDKNGFTGPTNKKNMQINRDLELYGNQNINADMSKFFKGRHPGILAQMKGNSKDGKIARRFNGTIKSGM